MNELRTSLKYTLQTLNKSIEFERTLNYPDTKRIMHQLTGISLLLSGMVGVESEKQQVDELIEQLRQE